MHFLQHKPISPLSRYSTSNVKVTQTKPSQTREKGISGTLFTSLLTAISIRHLRVLFGKRSKFLRLSHATASSSPGWSEASEMILRTGRSRCLCPFAPSCRPWEQADIWKIITGIRSQVSSCSRSSSRVSISLVGRGFLALQLVALDHYQRGQMASSRMTRGGF